MSTILFHPHKILIINEQVKDEDKIHVNGLVKDALINTMDYDFAQKSLKEITGFLTGKGYTYLTRG